MPKSERAFLPWSDPEGAALGIEKKPNSTKINVIKPTQPFFSFFFQTEDRASPTHKKSVSRMSSPPYAHSENVMYHFSECEKRRAAAHSHQF